LRVPHFQKEFEIKPKDFARAGEGAMEIQGILKAAGFVSALIGRVALCAYESEMNVVMHGGDGLMVLTMEPDEVKIEVWDDGPGIEDVELALQEGYSTALDEYREMGFGSGMGLPNIKKNADLLEISSGKGEGTHLRMRFWSHGQDQGTR
jgi:anti-sigma regulatory factor (Ser/Thr protein kinase)